MKNMYKKPKFMLLSCGFSIFVGGCSADLAQILLPEKLSLPSDAAGQNKKITHGEGNGHQHVHGSSESQKLLTLAGALRQNPWFGQATRRHHSGDNSNGRSSFSVQLTDPYASPAPSPTPNPGCYPVTWEQLLAEMAAVSAHPIPDASIIGKKWYCVSGGGYLDIQPKADGGLNATLVFTSNGQEQPVDQLTGTYTNGRIQLTGTMTGFDMPAGQVDVGATWELVGTCKDGPDSLRQVKFLPPAS